MKRNNNSPWRSFLTVLMVPILLAGGWALGGCSNDPVAPHENAPALSVDDVAHQAGWVAMAAGIVGPQTVEFTAKSDKNSYVYVFEGNVTGGVHLDFFTGGAGGTSATPAAADYVDLYTADGAPLVISVGLEGLTGTILLTLDLAADLNRDVDPDTATISGGGTLNSGPYSATFTFDAVAVAVGAAYPSSGSITLTGSGFTMTVTFDGDDTASLVRSDGATFTVNLDTGAVS